MKMLASNGKPYHSNFSHTLNLLSLIADSIYTITILHIPLETSCLATAIFILSLPFKFTIQATATAGAAQKKHWIGSAKMCD